MILLIIPITIVILLFILTLLPYLDMFSLLFCGKRFVVKGRHMVETVVMSYPLLYIWLDMVGGYHPTLAPAYRLTFDTLVMLCDAAYFYASYRKKLAWPLLEVIVNCLLLLGVLLDLALGIQIDFVPAWVFFILPVTTLFAGMLVDNHKLACRCGDGRISTEKEDPLITGCRRIVFLHPLLKFPVLLLACLPVLGVPAGALVLFGQRPDAIVRAFTDTCGHGFSQGCDREER
jgi:hypothetical protein